MTTTEALKRQPSAIVTCIGAFEIVLNYLCQILIIGDLPDVLSMIGSPMVILCIIAITLEPGQRNEYHAPAEQGEKIAQENKEDIAKQVEKLSDF